MIHRNILFAVDINDISNDIIGYSLTPIQLYLGVLMWPVILAFIIALVYRSTHNLGSVTAAIFLVFGLFGTTNGFIQTPEISLWFFIVAALGYSGTILTIFIKKRFE